jgi:hypothetical protein
MGHTGGGDRWWSIEELGEGASVVRSKSNAHGVGGDREVWVLRMGSDDHDGSKWLFELYVPFLRFSLLLGLN